MIKSIADYFSRLTAAFGDGWTRFWFTPTDPTVLCLMRVLTGMVVVYLHATLALDLVALFGPDGLLPVEEIAPLDGGNFSYLNYLSTPGELWTVHLAGLAILVLFMVGFWTRWTTIMALVVFLSDVHRAPEITGRTEPIVAMVLLYLCFAPCGVRYSLDALLARGKTGTAEPVGLSTLATIATRLIQVHLALLIAMMGFSKLVGESWWTGMGMWWLITRRESRLFDVSGIYAYPKLVDLWSHAILLFELSFPVLVWVPLARPLLLAAGVLVWASLAIATGDVTFSLMMGIASLAFVSPAFLRSCCRKS